MSHLALNSPNNHIITTTNLYEYNIANFVNIICELKKK